MGLTRKETTAIYRAIYKKFNPNPASTHIIQESLDKIQQRQLNTRWNDSETSAKGLSSSEGDRIRTGEPSINESRFNINADDAEDLDIISNEYATKRRRYKQSDSSE